MLPLPVHDVTGGGLIREQMKDVQENIRMNLRMIACVWSVYGSMHIVFMFMEQKYISKQQVPGVYSIHIPLS